MQQRRPDPDELKRLYIDQRLAVAEIAARLGVAHGTAHNWLRATGIELRPSPSTTRVDISDDQIRELYVDAGLSAAQVANRLGCSTSTIYGRLTRLGIDRRQPSSPRRPPAPELRRLYLDDGFSLRRIATRYDVTPQAVAGWLRHHHIAARPARTPPVDLDHSAIIDGYQAGLSAPQLAFHHDCSPATIYRTLDAAGIPRRPRPRVLTRDQLLDALRRHDTAEQIAARYDVSISTVCRALRHEGLETDRQAARRRSGERYAELLAEAEHASTADPATLDWLRQRAR